MEKYFKKSTSQKKQSKKFFKKIKLTSNNNFYRSKERKMAEKHSINVYIKILIQTVV